MISRSPQRNTFQKQAYLDRMAEQGRTPDNDETVRYMVEYYESWDKAVQQKEADAEWRRLNLEYDLRTSEKMLAKVRASESYAQNLYAAMCNQKFQKVDIWLILKDQTWGCSWRYAGGIVANMRGEGDYIDWYCSGRRNTTIGDEESEFWKEHNYVAEGVVTEEIRADLLELGWIVIENNQGVDS